MKTDRSTALGNLLRQKRAELNLSQRELAAKLAVTPGHVAYMESGKRLPSPALMRRIEKILGIGMQQMFLLAHPQADSTVVRKNTGHKAKAASTGGTDEAWRHFASDRRFLDRHAVTAGELRVFRELSRLGFIPSHREFLAILALVRGPRDL